MWHVKIKYTEEATDVLGQNLICLWLLCLQFEMVETLNFYPHQGVTLSLSFCNKYERAEVTSLFHDEGVCKGGTVTKAALQQSQTHLKLNEHS